jgi:hypothetical protein
MNIIVLPTNAIVQDSIYFLDSKNNILMDGIFTKLIYTNEWFTMNGLYIHLPIEIQGIDTNTTNNIYTKRGYNKQTIFFAVSQYSTLLHQLDLLEQHILSKYIPSDKTKHKSFLIIQSLKLGFFRIFKGENNNNNNNLKKKTGFVLKISGIWENSSEYGLSYKIMDASSSLSSLYHE